MKNRLKHLIRMYQLGKWDKQNEVYENALLDIHTSNTESHSFQSKTLRGSSLFKTNLLCVLMTTGMMQLHAIGNAQQITLKHQNSSIKTIIKNIEKQSGYKFFYKESDIQHLKNVSIDLKNNTLSNALDNTLKKNGLSYEIVDKTIIIKNSPGPTSNKINPTSSSVQSTVPVSGMILDKITKKPIPGVTIIAPSGESTISNEEGKFSFKIKSENSEVLVRYIGYQSKRVKIGEKIQVEIEPLENDIDQVVVTGMVNVNKSSFSGSTAAFKQEEIKAVTNTNAIAALRSLDPSFLIIENNLVGSNPNVTPTIEMRGQTSITASGIQDEFADNPNQPLFILDGFESSLRAIMDLDLTLISSITLLKDAASTAQYGSRAANGVVVVETIKPVAGKITLSYNADLTFDRADLSSYNMMNSAEKLEFERLSGVYNTSGDPQAQYDYYNALYKRRIEDVISGVDTYWLSEPIQKGFSNRHSLYARGGSENFLFNVGGSYKKQDAVMKGSGRNEWGSSLNTTYRKNNLTVNNNLRVNGSKGDESNYGSFTTWVNTNPYFKKESSSVRFLDEYIDKTYGIRYYISNPLYNAALNSFDRENSFDVTNNLQLKYRFNNNWEFQTQLQLVKSANSSKVFKSALHTDFEELSTLKRGTFRNYEVDRFSYNVNAMLSYHKVIKDKHILRGSGRIEVEDKTNTGLGFAAEGFPVTSNGNPAFAYDYQENGKPRSSKSIKRRNQFVLLGNYSFDQKYNIDISGTMDGSTSFGLNNSYQAFYSFGASWNIHNEEFIKDQKWINSLRLRANRGMTGTQNFPSSTSISTYDYLSSYNYLGSGVELATLGNENLKWQKTYQTSVGLDATLFNRLSIEVNYFKKLTNGVIAAIDLPLSTGITKYPFNAGNLSIKGYEFDINYFLIKKTAERFNWSIRLFGTSMDYAYSNFGEKLKSLNADMESSSSYMRYKDGYSEKDIWAVKSLGIDPATGRELFLNKNGETTFNYFNQDATVVGNTQPKITGTFSTTFNYKGLSLSAYMRYIYDQDILNRALYNKVENISLSNIINNNQDKRALYDRWKNVGDISQYKSISLTSTTPISSRFIQQENTLSLESITLGYQFIDQQWIKKAKLSNLKISANTMDLARFSTILRERGVEYPYAKTYSFTVSANF